jgi:predicted Zn-dependent protease
VLERARLWDYLGIRSTWLDDWNSAADAFARSAALLPTPRLLRQWAEAEVKRGEWERARDVCRLWTGRAPDDVSAWRTLAATVTHLNDRPAARTAAENILRLDSRDPDARGILEYLDRTTRAARLRRAPP